MIKPTPKIEVSDHLREVVDWQEKATTKLDVSECCKKKVRSGAGGVKMAEWVGILTHPTSFHTLIWQLIHIFFKFVSEHQSLDQLRQFSNRLTEAVPKSEVGEVWR